MKTDTKSLSNARRTITEARPQRGAALVVGLLLMLVLTVLGLSSMNTATLELAMAANSQTRQLAFQAAESGIELALASPASGSDAIVRATHTFGDGAFSVETETRCVEATDIPDASLDPDDNAHALHFEARATARGPRNAVARLVQGFYVRAMGSGCMTTAECEEPGCRTSETPWHPVRTYWRQIDVDD